MSDENTGEEKIIVNNMDVEKNHAEAINAVSTNSTFTDEEIRGPRRIWKQGKKTGLSILCIFFLTAFLLQGLAIVQMESEGVYYYDQSTVVHNAIEDRARRDSEWMLYHYLSVKQSSDEETALKSTKETFGASNFSFTIVNNTIDKDKADPGEYEININTPQRASNLVYVIEFGNNYGTFEDDINVQMMNYTVICGVSEELTYHDMVFYTIKALDLAYEVRYIIFATLLLSLLLGIVLLIKLVKQAGYRWDEDGIARYPWDKVPVDLSLCISVGMIAIMVNFLYDSFFQTAVDWIVELPFIIIYSIVIMTVGVWQILNLAVRIKLGKWWKNSLIYYVINYGGRAIVKCFQYTTKNMSVIWKVVVAIVALSILEICFTGICWEWSERDIFVTGLVGEKIIIIALAAIFAVQWNKLIAGSKKIAEGDLNYQIDTDKMPDEFKKYADNLNQISVGMQRAVEERMKSEHFKTELITNVSHDIKTPLTSIINYVDLLQKEDIPNESAQEYIEVLSRQSARLKKLIEDLIEASKASTGALKVAMEKCNIGVMLTQAAGEYEEKLRKNGMELILKQPEEDIEILADGRHLWRIFDNLMNNINKYAQPQTRVYLNLDMQDDHVTVTFRNTSKVALNVTSEELQERFVRGDSSRNTEGSGLGLSIARSLTELMKGQFDLIIDGDLFKVILTFPCSGLEK